MIQLMYMIFIGAIMVGNGIYFGPCTFRQYGAIYLFFFILFNLKSLKGYTVLLPAYFVFISFYGLSMAIDGAFSTFIRQFIALYLVSIVGYLSTILILKKYKTLNYFLNVFIIIGLFNSIITILQYYGIGFSYIIGGVFIDLNDPVKVSQFTRIMEGDHSNLIGIMGDIVYNGYYSMILPFFILIRLKHCNFLLQIILLFISLISLFMVGERSSFGITVILIFIYYYKYYRRTRIFKFVCIGVFLSFIFYIPDFIDSEIIRESRWMEEDSSARDNINKAILPFIFHHLLFGGLPDFIKYTGFPPHNVIASGFIYSGLVGGSCVVYILCYQAKVLLLILKKQRSLLTFAFGAYTLNGFFHNPAVVTGDAIIWILWAMVFFIYHEYNKTYVKKRKSPYISNYSCI